MNEAGEMTIPVGYIGLGTMGEPMARNILAAGFSTWVYDVNELAVARLVEAGATVAGSPRELAANCRVVMVNVVNDAQVEQVICAADTGLIDALGEGSVVVVHSTVHPDTCRRLAGEVAKRGVGLIDAPFTGGAAAAAAGTLSLLVGGKDWCVEKARPVLEAEGVITHLGDVGTGELAKLGNNLVIGITIHAVHEAIRLAVSAGLDSETMLAVLTSGAADCWAARNWDSVGKMTAVYPGGAEGLAALTHKDLSLAMKVAQDHGVRLRITEQAAMDLHEPYLSAFSRLSAKADVPADRGGDVSG
ncbi:MAG: NAD(P)-dependent oxidoreductase [Alphaproteobacteria bacterium]|nr:NAD(P)-dependent oxidoreductase [Alphaproteobacteria bacterium]